MMDPLPPPSPQLPGADAARDMVAGKQLNIHTEFSGAGTPEASGANWLVD